MPKEKKEPEKINMIKVSDLTQRNYPKDILPNNRGFGYNPQPQNNENNESNQ